MAVVAPLVHGIAHSEDLIFKIRAGFANPHMGAQGQFFANVQRTIFSCHHQTGNFFTRTTKRIIQHSGRWTIKTTKNLRLSALQGNCAERNCYAF
jgi:hypothetical protein